MDSVVDAAKALAAYVADGVYGDHDFIALPRPLSDSERAGNRISNYVWPDLYFRPSGDGSEGVYVKSPTILPGILLPVGGDLVTHWEYLTKKAADPVSVSTWIPVEEADRDGRPMWFVPESKEPLLFPLHSFVGKAQKKRANKVPERRDRLVCLWGREVFHVGAVVLPHSAEAV